MGSSSTIYLKKNWKSHGGGVVNIMQRYSDQFKVESKDIT